MNFALTEDQELLHDTATQFLADHCPPALLRAHRADIAAADDLWGHLQDFVPLGIGPLVDLCVFMEALGRVCAPVPFFAVACLYAPLLDAVGESIGDVMHGLESPVRIALGPEGGMEPAERDAFIGAAFLPVKLGESTLRFETAGVAAVAIVAASLALTRQSHG